MNISRVLFMQLLFAFCSFSFMCNGQPYYTDAQLDNFGKFDYGSPNDLMNVYIYNYTDVNNGINNFPPNFKYSAQKLPLVNKPLQISLQSINTIIADCRAFKGWNPASDFEGIRFWFAMDVTTTPKTMRLVAQPVQIRWGKYQMDQYGSPCDANNVPKFYVINANGTLTQSVDTPQMIRDYQQNVWLNHKTYDAGYQHKFSYEKDCRGDTKSAVIPIQELLAMYACNETDHKPGDLIQLQILANQNMINCNNFKLHIAAHYKLITTSPIPISYACPYLSLGADFTQMCPTNCDILWVPYFPAAYLSISDGRLPNVEKFSKIKLTDFELLESEKNTTLDVKLSK